MNKQKLDLTKHLQSVKRRKLQNLIFKPLLVLLLATPIVIWGILFVEEKVTLGGVPASVVEKFFRDPIAVDAFMDGNGSLVHERLRVLGVEEDIKYYYRPQFSDEIELDRYIHQLMYNWTGYIGEHYRVNPKGILVLTEKGRKQLLKEIEEQGQ